jgi:fibronectin type 3 domain-containing protein
MALIDLVLKRSRRLSGRATASQYSTGYRPQLEVLETRECPAVMAPSALQATALSSTQVKLTWTDAANETGYRVYRWNGSQAVFVAQMNANATTYTIGSLAANQTHWFIVESFDVSTTARSAWASATTPPQAITAPTVTVTSPTLTSLTVNWNSVSGATGYQIFKWDGSQAVQIGSVGSTVRSFLAQNLAPGQNHYFFVRAINATNYANSAWVMGTTQATLISPPTNVVAQAVSSSVINLSWNDGANEAGYRVYQWNGDQNTSPVVIATLAANATAYQATGLLAGRTYQFYIQAVNGSNTANSAWVQATTPGQPLQPPTPITATLVAPNTVRVNWTEPDRAVGYRVYVWAGYYWALYITVPRGTTQTFVTGLAQNRTQWFMVQSFTENFAENAYSNATYVYM